MMFIIVRLQVLDLGDQQRKMVLVLRDRQVLDRRGYARLVQQERAPDP